MSATIRFGKTHATVTDGVWHADDPILEQALLAVGAGFRPAGHDPDPDRSAAEYMLGWMGGELVSVEPTPPLDPNVVY
jgi:hypothetical protein